MPGGSRTSEKVGPPALVSRGPAPVPIAMSLPLQHCPSLPHIFTTWAFSAGLPSSALEPMGSLREHLNQYQMLDTRDSKWKSHRHLAGIILLCDLVLKSHFFFFFFVGCPKAYKRSRARGQI